MLHTPLQHTFDFLCYRRYRFFLQLKAREVLRMNIFKLGLCAALLASALFAVGRVSVADTLPKNAIPLSSAEVRAIYAGKSVIWRHKSGAYFASNGKVISVYTNWHNDINPSQKWTGYTTGTWSASGNQMCWRYGGYDLTENKAWSGGLECWKWSRSGSKYYTIPSKKPPGTYPAGANDYYTGERSKIRSGDRITPWFNEYKSKAKAQ